MIETGIKFGDIHSYDDLNLILSAEDIPPAEPKTSFIDVPGADGSLDMTEAHGEVKYSDRECTFTFTMNPLDSSTWEEKKTEVSNKLNGKVFKITLDKDEDYYYTGRCSVNEFSSDKRIKQIVIAARVHPYKFKQNVTTLNYNLTESQQTINITNARKAVSPTITCTNDNTVIVFGTATFNLSAGTHKVLDIRFVEGNNQLTLSGTGTVTFTFQEADL